MLQKLPLIFFLFASFPSSGQNSVCKEYYASEQENYKKTLRSITFYDKEYNVIRKVGMIWDGTKVFDTTDYFYENNMLLREVHFSPTGPVSRPVDSVVNYVIKHPKALGRSLHHIVKQNTCDTELTKYVYDARGLLIRKENAEYRNSNPLLDSNFYKKKLSEIIRTPNVVQRIWQGHLVTNYTYDDNGKLIQTSGDLYDDRFGTYAKYSEAARKYFYNAKNELFMDSIVTYNGPRFDGAVSKYRHFPGGYEVSVTEYGEATFFKNTKDQSTEKSHHYILSFRINDQGKILQEIRYDTKSAESKIEDPGTSLDKKNTYQYDSFGRLIKKSVYYSDTPEPQSIYYYTYE